MGRRRKDDQGTEQVKRRSSRLSARVTEEETAKASSPVKQSPKPREKRKEKVSSPAPAEDNSTSDAENNVSDTNKRTSITSDEAVDPKKSKMATADVIENNDTEMSEQKNDEDTTTYSNEKESTPEAPAPEKSSTEDPETSEGCVDVAKMEVPAHDSKEVQGAVKAQGEDGQLLVDFVQVSKDEIPASDSDEVVQSLPPQVSQTSPLEVGDSHSLPLKTSLPVGDISAENGNGSTTDSQGDSRSNTVPEATTVTTNGSAD